MNRPNAIELISNNVPASTMRRSGSPDALPPPVFGAARGGLPVRVGVGRCVGRVVALELAAPFGVRVPGTPVLGIVRAAAVLVDAVVAAVLVGAVVLTVLVTGDLVVGFLVGLVVRGGLLLGRVRLVGLVVVRRAVGFPVALRVGLPVEVRLAVLDGVGLRVEDPDEAPGTPAEAPEDVTTGVWLGAAVPPSSSLTWARQ